MSDEQIIEALAIKVMLWHRNSDGWVDAAGNQQRWVGSCGTDCAHPQFEPLTNPADSKQLREKLAERWDYHLNRIYTVQGGYFRFRLVSFSLTAEWQAEADTEELAVAKCALLTVGVKV